MYALKSMVNDDIYIGSCDDLKERFTRHNAGHVKSTQAYRPWVLVYYEAYRNKTDATKREKELKAHAAKKVLLERIKGSLVI